MFAFLAPAALKMFFGNALGGIWTALKRFFASLNAQGVVGLIASIFLAFQWLHARGEARHWRKQSDRYQALYTGEKTARDTTKANLLAAADKARRDDAANAQRVQAEQSAINERSSHDFEARIAAARAAAERLQRASAANSSNGGGAPVPGVSASPSGPAQASGQDGLSPSDALTATEQAIQLDELITWARRQHQVDTNKAPPHG